MGKILYVSNEAVVEHLRYLSSYMSLTEAGRRIGYSGSTLAGHTQRSRGQKKIPSDLAQLIMELQPRPGDLTVEQRSIGARRMLRGMQVKGWTAQVMAEFLPMTGPSMQRFLAPGTTNYPAVSPELYHAILRMTDKLETADPGDYGIAPSRQKQNRSRLAQYPSIGLWDLDTVHLPESIPQYTGQCGTSAGPARHYYYKILPVCAPCLKARSIAKRERRAT
jgi:hypothetical protein